MSRFSNLFGAEPTPAPKVSKKDSVKKVAPEPTLSPEPSVEPEIPVESDE